MVCPTASWPTRVTTQEGQSLGYEEYEEYRTAPHWCHNMSVDTKTQRSSRAKPTRQSVTIPAPLVAAVRRVAKERNLTMSRALVSLAERGIQADLEAKKELKAAYRRFMQERESRANNEAGKELIRVIFGADAIDEDTLPPNCVRIPRRARVGIE